MSNEEASNKINNARRRRKSERRRSDHELKSCPDGLLSNSLQNVFQAWLQFQYLSESQVSAKNFKSFKV